MHHGVHAHHHHRRQFGGFFGNDNGGGLFGGNNGKNPLKEVGERVEGFLTGGRNSDNDDNSDSSSSNTNKNSNSNSNEDNTVVSVVYFTPKPTFTGAVAGYKTMTAGDEDPKPTPKPSPSPTPSPKADDPVSSKEVSSKDEEEPLTTRKSSSKDAEPTSTPDSSSRQQTSLVRSIRVTSDSALATPTESLPSNAAASSLATETPLATAQPQGLSAGGKAGIAIGVILGLLFLIGAAYAFVRYRRNQEHKAMEEKNPFGDRAAAATPPYGASAPPAMAAAAAPAVFSNASATRNVETAQSANPSNPFGQHAETISSVPQVVTPSSDTDKIFVAAGAGAAAGAIGATAASQRSNIPKPLEINRSQSPALAAGVFPNQPSPAASQFSSTSLTSTAIAAGVAAGSPPSNVHRVQMDFRPSMEDELALTAGQLVRMIHEYDDGWVSLKSRSNTHLY